MTGPTLQDAVAALTSLGCKPTQSGAGYTAYCPVHEADHNGHKPSLSVNPGDQQSIVMHCHAGCSYPAIMDALGLKPEPLNGKRQIVATYPYHDAAGNEVRQKIRYLPKDFRIRHRGPDGYWIYKAGHGPAVLYRLPELIDGIASGSTVYLVEGEKDADRLASMGLCATTNIEGAAKPDQKPKWRKEYAEQLTGAARVVLIPDHDEPGRAHMAHIAKTLKDKVGDIRTVELPDLSGAKGDNDLSDWLNKSHTLEELLALVESAKVAPARPEPATAKVIGGQTAGGPDELLVIGNSLVKHNDAASLLYQQEFGGRLFYDPIMLDWFEYQPMTGVFKHRPGLAIEQAVYRAVTAHCGHLGFDAAYVSGVTRCLIYEAIKTPEPAVGKICFRNGVLDIATRELLSHAPEHHFTSSLPFNWTPDADAPEVVIDWIRESVSGHEDQVQLIRAYLNAIVVGRPDLQRFLEVIGAGGSGKGTLIRLATALVGKEAVHSTSLKQLEENRFETAKIFGKKLVVINDAEKWHGDVSMLKSITGEDAVRFEQKHKQAGESFTYGGMVIIAANQHTDSTDYSSGIQRRRITIPFDHVVPAAQRRDLEAEFEPHLPGLLKWVLDMPQSEVTAYLRSTSAHTQSLLQARLDALAATNPMIAWMLDRVHFDENVSTKIGEKNRLTISEGENGATVSRVEYAHQSTHLYPNYCQWCDANGKMPVSKNQFSGMVLDAAKNSLGKAFVRYERKATGRMIIGMSLEFPCQPMSTYDNLMTTQVIDSAELDNLSTFSEVNNIWDSLNQSDSSSVETAEYGETFTATHENRQVQHNQQDRLTQGCHWLSSAVIGCHGAAGNAGNAGNAGKADLTQSPTATRILDCLAGDLAGMNDATVISATVGKAGAALAQATINALLQAGKITKINGRLVMA